MMMPLGAAGADQRTITTSGASGWRTGGASELASASWVRTYAAGPVRQKTLR